MSDSVLIAIVIAVAVVIVLLLFRDRLQSFRLKAGMRGVDAALKAADGKSPRRGLLLRGNWQIGSGHVIKAEGTDVEASGNKQIGEGSQIEAGGAATSPRPGTRAKT